MEQGKSASVVVAMVVCRAEGWVRSAWFETVRPWMNETHVVMLDRP